MPGRWGALCPHRHQRRLFSLGLAGAVGALGWPVCLEFPPFLRDCISTVVLSGLYYMYVWISQTIFPTSSHVFFSNSSIYRHSLGASCRLGSGVRFWGHKDEFALAGCSSHTLFTKTGDELTGWVKHSGSTQLSPIIPPLPCPSLDASPPPTAPPGLLSFCHMALTQNTTSWTLAAPIAS